jgi:hypothetical protein
MCKKRKKTWVEKALSDVVDKVNAGRNCPHHRLVEAT